MTTGYGGVYYLDMTYVPVSQANREYVARRMADGVSEQDAWDMLEEQYAQCEDEGRPEVEAQNDDDN